MTLPQLQALDKIAASSKPSVHVTWRYATGGLTCDQPGRLLHRAAQCPHYTPEPEVES